MPCLGLTSFLPLNCVSLHVLLQSCVNALSRANLISTFCLKWEKYMEKEVSMPCLGLTSFLRNEDGSIMENEHGVSMPCLGLTSFLQRMGLC